MTAVVVTYKRPEVLKKCLIAVTQQTRTPDQIIVIDNDSKLTAKEASEGFSLTYAPAGGNVGYAAGISIGYEMGLSTTDIFWVLDDDSIPEPTSLSRLLNCMENHVGIVANRGGHIRFGRIRHDLPKYGSKTAEEADFTLIDGAIIRSQVIQKCGSMRDDLFMMLEDFEFTTRAKACGFNLLVIPADQTEHYHLGSTAPWRGYYQSRNLLRISLERRSLPLIFGWAIREFGALFAGIKARQWQRINFRFRGVIDGIFGRMGYNSEIGPRLED